MDIKIRLAVPIDLIRILEVFLASVWATCDKEYTREECRAWASSAKRTNHWLEKIKRQYFLVATYNLEMAGFASLSGNSYIDLLYVSPYFQRKGIAVNLLGCLEERALEMPNSGGQILSTHASKAARAFFLKRGYIQLQENFVIRQGVRLKNFYLEKSLML